MLKIKLTYILVAGVLVASSAAGDPNDKIADAGGQKPVLWQEPTEIERMDLFHGPGGPAGAPDPKSVFTFNRRSKSGTSEKIIVEDDKGREWTVKFGAEARPETAATRLVWAAGYHVDQNYFVKHTYIQGRGGFEVRNVRFERRDDGFKEVAYWSWDSNPFVGTRELDGLKVLMALLKNWDLKMLNNKVMQPGKKHGGPNARVRAENARWIGTLLARLSDKQLADAFYAGGFDESETQFFVRTIRTRIDQLRSIGL